MALMNDILQTWANKSIRGLIANYDRKGLRASGDFAESLNSEIKSKESRFNVAILGNDYTEQLEIGRRPNKKNSHKELAAWAYWASNKSFANGGFIAKWLEDKGLNYSAFGVAYNIAKFGIKVPNTYNDGGLVSEVFTDENINKLNRQISLFYIDEVKSDIKGLLK